MTFLTTHPLIYVPLVREIDVIRQGVNSLPWNIFLVSPEFLQSFYTLFIPSVYLMAEHALLDRWHSGNGGQARICVTVKARDSVVTCVDVMAEGDWLFQSTRPPDHKPQHEENCKQHQAKEDDGFEEPVMKRVSRIHLALEFIFDFSKRGANWSVFV
jgi:hypothetical protein